MSTEVSTTPKTDLEIARSAKMLPITELAQKLGIDPQDLEQYGNFKAKLPLELIDDKKVEAANLVLVTAMTPTPPGEGKTTVTIGLNDGLNRMGKKSIAVLREPSLGPVFGVKGGAAGGGHAQVIPMEDINLHFTGDFSAIEKSNNLLAALVDNATQSLNWPFRIDPRTVRWKRVIDMNDRALRSIITGLGGKTGGISRETGFDITAASEIMAILCLAQDRADLKKRLSRIYVGDTFEGKPIFAEDLRGVGAMAVLLKDAIKPNLVQTLENHPALIHGGPFANIAQGTNSVIATRMGMSLADFAITEAGFGADLGAEKFLDIKCRAAGLKPKATVMVATIRALKYHGGEPLSDLTTANARAVTAGLPNLIKHIENMQAFKLPVVVALNRFYSDTEEEIEVVRQACADRGVSMVVYEAWEKGGEGAMELAAEVARVAESGASSFEPIYELSDTFEEKVEKVATQIYGAEGFTLMAKPRADLTRFRKLGLDKLPICIAKTQNSFSDNAKLLGRPEGHTLRIREIEIAAGAGFLIPIAGNMLRMPGLPAEPAANHMDIDNSGTITGLS